MLKLFKFILGRKYEYWKNRARVMFTKALPTNVSYSQFGEDVMVNYYFEQNGINKGTYIDVGAYHPVYMSNTYRLYTKGWSGLNIDPTPGSMNLFNLYRPDDVNLEAAVAEKEGDNYFHIFNSNPELNTLSLSDDMKEHYASRNIKPDSVISVQTYPLYQLCDKYLDGRTINFISVDAEGHDLNVLKTFNWQKHQPQLVLVEAHTTVEEFIQKTELYKFLTELNYSILAKNGPSYLFMHQK
jgi:FkbM family methyltransferase